MPSRIQDRRDTASNWTSRNPVLAAGEHGYEIGTGKLKVGDGVTTWSGLAYRSDDAYNAATYATPATAQGIALVQALIYGA